MSYTVKQIADFLQLSKPTIRKHIKRLSDEDRSGNYTDEDGTLHISDHCYMKLLELLGVETGAETLSGNLPETPRKNGGNTGNDFPEMFPETFRKQVETLENTVETLGKHIEQLYKQIEAKDDQIKQLTILLSQQQTLQLKQLEAIPDRQEQENQHGQEQAGTEQKTGFIKRLFRKKL